MSLASLTGSVVLVDPTTGAQANLELRNARLALEVDSVELRRLFEAVAPPTPPDEPVPIRSRLTDGTVDALIDPTARALRVLLYDPAGNPLVVGTDAAPVTATWTNANPSTGTRTTLVLPCVGAALVELDVIANGTTQGIVLLEASDDNQQTWVQVNVYSLPNPSSTTIAEYQVQGQIQLNGLAQTFFQVPCAGFTHVRVRLSSALNAGSSVALRMQASGQAPQLIQVSQGEGAAIQTPWKVADSNIASAFTLNDSITNPSVGQLAAYMLSLDGTLWERLRSGSGFLGGGLTTGEQFPGALQVQLVPTGCAGRFACVLESGALTGVGAAGIVFAFLNAATGQASVAVQKVIVTCVVTSTVTTAQLVELAMIVCRSFTAADTGGTAATLTGNNQKKRTSATVASLNGGGIRIASTAALTAGTRTPDAQAIAHAGFWAPLTTTGEGVFNLTLFDVTQGATSPLVLAVNEGFEIQMPTALGSGTIKLVVTVQWFESATY